LAARPGRRDTYITMTAERPSPSAPADRRTRRSDDTMMALHYQLAFVRHEADLDALVLADPAGCLVAGAGAWPTCELLAAYAPVWRDGLPPAELAGAEDFASVGLAPPDSSVEVRSVMIDGLEVLLCSRGGSRAERDAGLARAAAGCQRILLAQA